MRILVVEDDKDVAGFIIRGLKEAGHVVEHADNGRDGLFMAASETYDTIVLDRMLPGGIDGLKILETLRAQRNATPVLILSALADVNERVKGLKARGNIEIDITWANGKAATATLRSTRAQTVKLRPPTGQSLAESSIRLSAGKARKITFS